RTVWAVYELLRLSNPSLVDFRRIVDRELPGERRSLWFEEHRYLDAVIKRGLWRSNPQAYCGIVCQVEGKLCNNLDQCVAVHRQAHTRHQLRHKIIHSRSEEHTSELQSRVDLVCRLLLEK